MSKISSIIRRVLPGFVVLVIVAPGIFITPRTWHNGPTSRPIALTLISGWQPSAHRLAKAWHVEWPELALWFAAGLLALLLMHSIIRWLSHGNSSWRVRSTSLVFALLGVILLFAMSAMGIAHQTGWWITSADSKWRSSMAFDAPLGDAFEAERVIRHLATQGERMPASKLRSAISSKLAQMYDTMFFTVFEDAQGMATGVLIAPRDDTARSRIGYILISAMPDLIPNESSQPIDNAAIDRLLFGRFGPSDRWIKAGDFTTLSSKLQRFGVDSTPFLERWRLDQ